MILVMFHFIGILFALLSLALAAHTAGYDGYKVYEVIPRTGDQCDLLSELAQHEQLYDFIDLTKLTNRAVRVIVHPDVQQQFAALLQRHELQHTVLVENLGVSVTKEFHENRRLRTLIPYVGSGRLSTERYYTHDEINAYIENLAERFPKRVFVRTVGKSFERRLLKTITITNGDGRENKNIIFMDGGFHAREWISPAAVIYAIEQLVERFAENTEILQDYDWVVLPVVNADGYEYTQLSPETRIWRKTRQPNGDLYCYGTDPNRNFDFHWNEEGASSNPCSNTYAGPKPFSEPEAVVVRDLMHSQRGRGIMYLTVHSSGNLILYPWGWTHDLPDTWEDLHEVAAAGSEAIYEATGTNYTIGSSTNVLYIAAGASDDYAFNAGYPISFTMELPAGGTYGFDPPPSMINDIVMETWVGIRAMAKKVVEKYPLEG